MSERRSYCASKLDLVRVCSQLPGDFVLVVPIMYIFSVKNKTQNLTKTSPPNALLVGFNKMCGVIYIVWERMCC